jgi:hypothetical protein
MLACSDYRQGKEVAMEPTILFKEYGTMLEYHQDGTYHLHTLCGTIAQYGLAIILTPDEIQCYKEVGDLFVQKLSLKVRTDPDAFRPRGILS